MTIGIIIPTFNEAQNIGRLLSFLQKNGGKIVAEIVVVDGGSTDETVQIAQTAGAKVIISEKKGRAAQMNTGAKWLNTDCLYFVHADTIPPENFVESIVNALQNGLDMGCFRYRFDSPSRWLRINAWFTRFEFLWCQGGDKTFFIKKEIFEALGGYDEHFVIMEEYDFIRRARQQYSMRTLPACATVSARKYENNSWLRVQVANLLVFNGFKWGVAPQRLKNWYTWWLSH